MTSAPDLAAGAHTRRGWRRTGWFRAACAAFLVLSRPALAAEDDEPKPPPGPKAADGESWLNTGDYAKVIAAGQKALGAKERTADWALLLGRALLDTGRYPEAESAITNALGQWPTNLRLRWLAREVFESNGDTTNAETMLREIRDLVTEQPWRYREPANLVAYGQMALALGADPRQVLDKVFAAVKKADPTLRDVFLAEGELALNKHDSALAAKAYRSGGEVYPADPEFTFGLARAYADSDQGAMLDAIHDTLKLNPRHAPSLLLLADHQIDAEEYAGAERLLAEAEAINPWHPDLWSYRAVLAHLHNDVAAETAAREKALHYWNRNPRVDHLIGLKLSQKYRFAEGEPHQRQALAFNPDYLPAKAQRASDLLRLGDEAEGWRLARQVHADDGYDVEVYNLVTLHDTMAKWAAVTNAHFVVRMEPHEAAVYGPRALALLERARDRLGAKYGVAVASPTYVEIFPSQKDFGVRTFGMPDNPGFLGVCFGRVVTATSPAANTAQPVNWEAVLWHEFCHVVTLQLTRNRMPRWLSEGISVYEELQADPRWGQRMTPEYREMVLGEELTPVSKLSGAFLAPKSEMHLQFAYYESELVVEFLVERYGLDALKAVLRDLGEGVGINPALEKRAAPLAELDKNFAAYARRRAEQLAPLDWSRPSVAGRAEEAGAPGRRNRRGGGRDAASGPAADLVDPTWAAAHPTNYWALRSEAQRLTADRQWAEARKPLEKLLELYPGQKGQDSAYPLLAAVLREQGQTNAERQVLARWAATDAEAAPGYLRLMDLAGSAGDWPEAARNAQRFLGVNPLVETPYRVLAAAADALGDEPTVIAACRAQLQLDPANPAEIHFLLARSLAKAGDPAARAETLAALEDAPRNRAALKLLLELDRSRLGSAKPGTNP